MNIELDERGRRYLEDVRWVQDDILKIPDTYPTYPLNECEIFSDRVLDQKWSNDARIELQQNLKVVRKVLQGPFYLGDGISIGGFWNKFHTCRATLGAIVPESLSGARVLEIGSMSGYDSFFMNLRNPEYYLSIEPSGYHFQARLLNQIYNTPIDFLQTFWQDLDHKYNESFDYLLNCGCLYHEYDFIGMVKRTADLLRLNGTMILATAVIKDPAHDGFIKYMPDTYAGDMTYWFAIGEKALVDVYASFGCSVEKVLDGGQCGDSGNGFTVEGHEAQNYNYYKIIKLERKSRPLITIPRY
ncbi:class I SAM-dependent methyltransferase [Paraburkholderia megapolitana]|uniref:class I SAM-dependent methyltransferase n=1 Tax=Paraburkholderia megapolitana TaxID=420953 RepID=UPI0038B9D5CE